MSRGKPSKLTLFKRGLKTLSEYINAVFDFLWSIIRPFFSNIFQMADEGSLSERVAVWVGIILTIYCVQWCFGLILNPPDVYSGVDVAAICGAILTPLAGMTAALMKYGEGIRRNSDKAKQDKESDE